MKISLAFIFSIVTYFSFSQSLVSITPDSAETGAISGTMTVIGNNTHWNSGAGIYYVRLVSGTDTVYNNSMNIISDTEVEVTFFIQGNVPEGCYDVQAYDLTAGLVTLPCGFTITYGGPSSYIQSISPSAAVAGGTSGPFEVVGYNTFWNTGAGLYWVRLVGFGDTLYMSTLNSITNDTIVSVDFFFPTSTIIGCYDVEAYDLTVGVVTNPCVFFLSGGTVYLNETSKNEDRVHLYPNPAKDFVTIEVENHDQTTLQIVDMNGKLVFEKDYTDPSIIQVDVTDITPGIYVFALLSDQKLIKQERIKIE